MVDGFWFLVDHVERRRRVGSTAVYTRLIAPLYSITIPQVIEMQERENQEDLPVVVKLVLKLDVEVIDSDLIDQNEL
jgi:hypothetical protein